MMKAHISTKLFSSPISLEDGQKLILPDGCIGILHVFRSKKVAAKFHGSKYSTIMIEYCKTKRKRGT